MQYIALLIVMAVLAIYVIKRIREQFLETSYYYEAAPGARGSRLICMPESRGTASLGIGVNSAASKAVNSCAPLNITYKPKKKKKRIPKMCLQYVGSGKPTRVVSMRPDYVRGTICPNGTIWDGAQCMQSSPIRQTSPGCPPGTIWDGKKCRAPRAPVRVQTKPGCPPGTVWDGKKCRAPKNVRTSPGCRAGTVWDGKKCRAPKRKNVKTSPGCRAGTVWDGKKCRIPRALNAAIKDPSRPKTPKKKGKSTANPNGKVKYRKVKGGTFPFMQINGKWVRVKKVNGKWKVVTVSKTNCPKGKKWDGKKKKCVKTTAKTNCPKGKKWNGKKKKCVKK